MGLNAGDWDAAAYAERFSFVPEGGRDLVAWLDPQPSERILDLGCGTGTLAAAIAATGAHVEGVDRDEAMLQHALREHPGISFWQGDGQELTTERPFDAVFSNAALHWIPDQDAVTGAVAGALRPGGRFVVEMGGRRNIAAIEGPLRVALADAGLPLDQQPRPWVFPSPAEQCARLERHGFEVRRLAYFDRPTPLEGGEPGLRDWLRMFGAMYLAAAPMGREEVVVESVIKAARPALFQSGRWVADYVRLRFLAVLA
jgi:SAM-dependent methyltransferase